MAAVGGAADYAWYIQPGGEIESRWYVMELKVTMKV
jgi:hypothetical protein